MTTHEDPRYHEASPEELLQLARRIVAQAEAATLVDFVVRHYGEGAHAIEMAELGEYNDENFGYGQVSSLIDEQPFRVTSAAGEELYPDLELPAWGELAAEHDRYQHGNFPAYYGPTDTQDALARARAFAQRVPPDERVAASSREDGRGDAYQYFSFLEEHLCELRCGLPAGSQAIDDRHAVPPAAAGKIYIQESEERA